MRPPGSTRTSSAQALGQSCGQADRALSRTRCCMRKILEEQRRSARAHGAAILREKSPAANSVSRQRCGRLPNWDRQGDARGSAGAPFEKTFFDALALRSGATAGDARELAATARAPAAHQNGL